MQINAHRSRVDPSELVQVATVYGERLFVLTSQLADPDRTFLTIYQKTGLSLAAWMEQMRRPALSTRLHRENIAGGESWQ